MTVADKTVRASGAHEPGRRLPRRRWLAGGTVVVLVAAAGVVVAVVDPYGDGGKRPTADTHGTALAAVREGRLSSQVDQSGTLSYAGRDDGTPYSIVNRVPGIFTWVPNAGDEIKCGRVLYWVGDTPVPLLCGSRPAYRNLSEGDSGRDVRQLNKNLVDLGYATKSQLDPGSKYFGSATATALKKLQDKIGADETGSLDLGAAVFLPGPLRITKAMAKLGSNAMPGGQLAEALTTERQVTVDLDGSQQSQVKVGDRAQITLPDNSTTTGRVSRIGTVASASGKDSGSDASSTTIPVYITLGHPKDAGDLDQAPVTVEITTKGVDRALIVPVNALVGQAGGGYAVEKVDARGGHAMVPVTLGLFDTANGQVQVSGNLAAGDRVVVPAT